MYGNLKYEIIKNGVTQREIAEFLGIHENSIGNKISGDSSFSVEEAFRIKERFFPSLELRYLFMKSNTA